jgi:hypothetical protein
MERIRGLTTFYGVAGVAATAEEGECKMTWMEAAKVATNWLLISYHAWGTPGWALGLLFGAAELINNSIVD